MHARTHARTDKHNNIKEGRKSAINDKATVKVPFAYETVLTLFFLTFYPAFG